MFLSRKTPFVSLLTLSAVFWGTPVPNAKAEDIAYLENRAPVRRALVVANSNYTTAERLPGTSVDADKVEDVLKRLEFVVTVAKDVESRNQFINLYLLPFAASVSEGDIAVFYFSGHGFTYAGENYLAPLTFPKTVKVDEIFSTFVSATAVHSFLADRRPSFVLLLLDACRDIGSFVIENAKGEGERLTTKGLAETILMGENVVIGFSSAAGTRSIGGAPQALSIFTKALVKYLPVPDKELDFIRKEVRFSVQYETTNKQIPWFSESSSAEVYFKASPTVIDQQKLLWQSVLAEGTRKAVSWFASRYGSGPYGFAARRWLKEHPDAPEERASSVSPIGPELLWELGEPNDQNKLITFDGALRPQSSIAVEEIGRGGLLGGPNSATRRLGRDITAGAISTSPALSRDAAAVKANALSTIGQAIVFQDVEGKSQPRIGAPSLERYSAGSRLEVKGVQIDSEKNIWLKVRASATDPELYVKQETDPSASMKWLTDIGSPLQEISLKPRAQGVRGLIDDKPLRIAARSIAATGKTMKWASISAPGVKDSRTEPLTGIRTTYIKSVLVELGIPRQNITIVTASATNPEKSEFRVRLFGE